MRRFVLVILFLVSTHLLWSQVRVGGLVSDKATQKGMENVSVYIYPIQKILFTDSLGKFSIELPENREYYFEFSAIGYPKTFRKIFTKDASQHIEVILDAEEGVEAIDEIVVTSGSLRDLEKTPIPMKVIEQRDVFEAGSLNFAVALAMIPGVSNSSIGNIASKPVIRGLTNTNVLMLNNGVKLENFNFSSNHPFLIDEFAADRIEMIKGPASLIYGSDAVGGVINVLKEKPAPEGKILGDFRTQFHSNTSGLVSSLGIKGSSESFFAGLRTSLKSHTDYMDGESKYMPNTRFRELHLNSHAGLRTKWAIFTLYYDYNKYQNGLLNSSSATFMKYNSDRDPQYWYQDLDNHLLTLKNTFFLGKSILDIDIAYGMNQRKGVGDTLMASYKTTKDLVFSSMTLNTVTYNAKLTLPSTEKAKYTIGFNGASIINIADEKYPNYPLLDAEINDLGLFGLAEYNLGKLNILAGARFDYRSINSYPIAGNNRYAVDNNYQNVTGSLGATYSIAENQLVKLNFASGYRSPNVSELTQNGIHQARYEKGDPTLQSQRNYQIDFNYHFHTKNLLIDFSPFYNTADNYIYIVQTTQKAPIGGGNVFQYIQNDATLYGTEFSLDYHPLTWLGLHSSYSMVRGILEDSQHLTFMPQDKIRAEVKFEKEKLGSFKEFYFGLGVLNVFEQERYGEGETFTPSYFLLNARMGASVSWGKQRIELFVNATNLLNENYVDHLSLIKTIKVAGKDTTFYNMGRNVAIGFTVPFGVK
ncbi:MAG: TonB-dependent receptor [Thermonemataceae bacterium]|nr:TonB-dependent receptor [Thermonemataceae bacterium]